METVNNRELRETAMNSYASSQTATVFSEERKWISKILRLKEQYPDEVTIQDYNTDFGSIVATVPQSWMKMSPKRKISEKQKLAASERFKQMYQKRNVE